MNDLKRAINAPDGLIDANELMEWLRSKIRECVMLNAHSEAAITEEIMRYVKCIPAVDAIPVEWIRSKITGAKKDAGAVIHDGVLKELLFDWQKEQEAR